MAAYVILETKINMVNSKYMVTLVIVATMVAI
jgi:hypothetical protein